MSFMIALFLTGMIVGAMGAFLGIGGGVVIIPLLTIVFKFPIHEAVATSLALVVANSVAASYKYLSKGTVNMKVGYSVAIFSCIGAIIGSIASVNMPERFLYLILGTAQVVTVAIMLINRKRKSAPKQVLTAGEYSYYDEAEKLQVYYTPARLKPVYGVSTVAGVLSGLVGVGGGVFLVPAMNLLGRLPMKVATATSSFLMGYTATAGGIIFFLAGYTRADTFVCMLPGIFLGTAISVRFVAKVNNAKLQLYFMFFVLLVAINMYYRGIFGG